ncbi:hypothetical protein P7C73_g1155, partial [Tremellales sp. Uapishka_1]
MLSLHGKITGGSRGIGAAVALDLGKAGAHVLMVYTSPSSKLKSESIALEIQKSGGVQPAIVQGDVGAADIGETLAKAVKEHFSNGKVDILVHNAGVSIDFALPDVSPADWQNVMNINVRGPFFITQALEPSFSENARIIFSSSVSARAGFVDDSAYGGSKAAIEAYIKSWPKEQWARSRKITVNGLSIGPCETDMFAAIPAESQAGFRENPVADPQDISNIVMLLCNPLSAWINGSIVNANNAMLTN